MTHLIRPTLNLNGSSREDLVQPRIVAATMIDAVVEALKAATPNGRDYPGYSEMCRLDRDTHYARIDALRRLQADLLDEIRAINKQSM